MVMTIDETDKEASAYALELFAQHPEPTGRLLFVLNGLQERFRYLPASACEVIASELGLEDSDVRAFASAFRNYSLDPVGRVVVEVCDGAACHAAGAEKLIAKLEGQLGIKCGTTSDDGLFTLRTVRCVGSCSAAPITVIEGDVRGHMRISQMGDLISQIKGLANE
ncbi:MAG: NAD(P)H-dependent oxidoreductase subunit E [Coriobacteriia bacterium]|nr:MAG: NAD(P)H-dependent oxidoreductase subunit E [Coriobacteriia bacterium]